MSTRSVIAEKTEKGITGIYCHYDGYPEHQAPRLLCYNTSKKVKALLELGDLSILGKRIGRKHNYDQHFALPEARDWCLAYSRDRGEILASPVRFSSEEELLKYAKEVWAEYLYLFENEQWFYRPIDADRWLPLSDFK